MCIYKRFLGNTDALVQGPFFENHFSGWVWPRTYFQVPRIGSLALFNTEITLGGKKSNHVRRSWSTTWSVHFIFWLHLAVSFTWLKCCFGVWILWLIWGWNDSYHKKFFLRAWLLSLSKPEVWFLSAYILIVIIVRAEISHQRSPSVFLVSKRRHLIIVFCWVCQMLH